MKFIKHHAVAALLGALAFASRSHANLIVNGNFGSFDFSDWTQSGNVGGDKVVFVVSGAGGQPGASLQSVGTLDYLSQTFSTQVGQTYQVQFDFKGGSTSPQEFDALFGAPTVLANSEGLTAYHGLTDLLTLGGPLNDEQYNSSSKVDNWTTYTFLVQATSTTSELIFASREDKGFDLIEDVDVTQSKITPIGGTSAVPEPSTYGLIGAAGLVFVALSRRLRAKSVTE